MTVQVSCSMSTPGLGRHSRHTESSSLAGVRSTTNLAAIVLLTCHSELYSCQWESGTLRIFADKRPKFISLSRY